MRYTDLVHSRDGLIIAKALLYLSKICGSPVVVGCTEKHSFTAPVTADQFSYACNMMFRAEGRPLINHRPDAVQYVWKLERQGRLIFLHDTRAKHVYSIQIFVRTRNESQGIT